jgi:amino-acid N-acetyltransferase
MERFHFFKPTVKNIADMQNLVLSEVTNGNILDRSSSEMATTIRSYTVVYHDDLLVGFVALHIHTPSLAEIRSLVVHNEYRGQGIGSELILKAMSEAKQLDLEKILVLTYQQQLFTKYGFNIIEKESIPETKIWLDCVKCKHFPICDEIALLKEI